MGPLITWTNAALVEQGSEESFTIDHDCSTLTDGENKFSAELPISIALQANAAVFVDGTDVGGLVIERDSDTRVNGFLVWKGRTWQGVLADKRVVPASGDDHYVLSGKVGACITALVSHVGLSDLFAVGECPDVSINSYQFSRAHGYCDAWEGLLGMLASVGLRPTFTVSRSGGAMIVLIGAVEARTLDEEVDGENADLAINAMLAPYNHAIGMGQGDGADRDVVNYYSDASGNISTTQTFFGVAERVLMYDSPSSDHESLVEGTIERLSDAQGEGEVKVTLSAGIDICLGDFVKAYDHRIGASVTAMVTGCVTKVSNGRLTRNWTAGE